MAVNPGKPNSLTTEMMNEISKALGAQKKIGKDTLFIDDISNTTKNQINFESGEKSEFKDNLEKHFNEKFSIFGTPLDYSKIKLYTKDKDSFKNFLIAGNLRRIVSQARERVSPEDSSKFVPAVNAALDTAFESFRVILDKRVDVELANQASKPKPAVQPPSIPKQPVVNMGAQPAPKTEPPAKPNRQANQLGDLVKALEEEHKRELEKLEMSFQTTLHTVGVENSERVSSDKFLDFKKGFKEGKDEIFNAAFDEITQGLQFIDLSGDKAQPFRVALKEAYARIYAQSAITTSKSVPPTTLASIDTYLTNKILLAKKSGIEFQRDYMRKQLTGKHEKNISDLNQKYKPSK